MYRRIRIDAAIEGFIESDVAGMHVNRGEDVFSKSKQIDK